MFAIVTNSRRLSLPLDILFALFDRVVLPVVLYASEMYGHNDSCIKKLEIFQRSLYKKALKLSKSTPSAGACPGIRKGGGGQNLKALFCFLIFYGGRASSENS